jgi:hypothetical protein
MIYVDAALLNLIEGACRRFQVLTGRTNVWLAFQLTNLSIVVYFVLAAVYFWSSPAVARIALVLFCGGLLYLLTQTIFKVTVEAHESSAYRRVTKGLRNPRRVRDAPLRIAFLTLSVLLFFPMLLVHRFIHQSSLHISGLICASPLLSYSLIALTTSVLYLLACDPLPPCAGRITEWIRALLPARRRTSESGVAIGSALQVRVIPMKNMKPPFPDPRYEMINPTVQPHGDVALLRFNLVTFGKLPDGPERPPV